MLAIPVELSLALELYYWEGLSGPDLALALDVPLGTARSRLRRGIERLREHLADAPLETDAALEDALRGAKGAAHL